MGLVLHRKRDEKIMIGDDIVIHVVEILPGKCKIDITAPKSLPVHRQEIYDLIKREEKKSA